MTYVQSYMPEGDLVASVEPMMWCRKASWEEGVMKIRMRDLQTDAAAVVSVSTAISGRYGPGGTSA